MERARRGFNVGRARRFAIFGLTACLFLPPLAKAQISGVSITNLSDAPETVDTTSNHRARTSATTVSSGPTSISGRYTWVVSADGGFLTNSTQNMSSSYRVNFTVNVPGAYSLAVSTSWVAGITTVDDATSGTTGDVSALTGTQSGGSLASGTLSLADPGSRSSNATGMLSFSPSAAATITGTSNGSNIAHQMQFGFTNSCVSNGSADLTGADECAIRGGIQSPAGSQTAGNYPGAGSLARTQANDGHFVTVTLTSFCGNSIVDAGVGEQCDQGLGVNGTPGSCCTSNCLFKAAATECRAAAGVCDIAEACSGSSGNCPADAVKISGFVCRAGTSGESCDFEETCDGVGTTCPPDTVLPNGTLCRAAAGDCDIAELCDGSSKVCPVDVKSTAECRASGGVCDVAEQCNGVSNTCPADAKSAATCRASAGVCDLVEQCDGVNNACPSDAKSTAVCRPNAGTCDIPESCDGSGDDCPADVVQAAATECRAVAGICDVAEACDGSTATCPIDAFLPNTTVCRAASVGEVCDIAESCTGSAAACPADVVEPATTLCRAAVGVCDLADFCDGSGKLCPSDAKSTAVCRAAADICDVAEVCDGVGDDCAADSFEPATTVCRAASVGEACDAAELCTGSGVACPADGALPNGTQCRVASVGEACDVAEACDGVSHFCPADGVAILGTPCRAAVGVCDVAESCDGVASSCPADGVAVDGTSCADGDFCDGSESCQSGTCSAGSAPCGMGQSCDEASDQCFAGSCPVSASTCRAAGKSVLLIKDKTDDAKDKLVYKWLKGEATSQLDLANPTSTATYALCLYTDAGLIGQAEVPPSATKWSAIGTKGYKYKDKTGAEDGIQRIVAKGGTAGKSKVLFKGKGGNLPDLMLPISMGDLPLTVQVRNNQTGICFGSSFATPKKNDSGQFKAKTP